MYIDEMRHFLNSVRSQKRTCNPVDNAAKVTRIALAAKRASLERRFVNMEEE